jgi:RNA polymerase-binding transcription factor DksA
MQKKQTRISSQKGTSRINNGDSQWLNEQRKRLFQLKKYVLRAQQGNFNIEESNIPEHYTSALQILLEESEPIYEIEHALKKIKTGNYGICETSGKKIPKNRLQILPHARYRIEYEENYDSSVLNSIDIDEDSIPEQASHEYKVILKWVFIALIVICAIITKPSKKDHIKAIEEDYPTNFKIQTQAKSAKYRNYVLMSLIAVKRELVSIGIFNNILIFETDSHMYWAAHKLLELDSQ